MRDIPFENPLGRAARIAGWLYLPVHIAVLPLFLPPLLGTLLGEALPDTLGNLVYYGLGLLVLMPFFFTALRRSFRILCDRFVYSLSMMFAAYGLNVLLALLFSLVLSMFGELPAPNNDAVAAQVLTDRRRMIAIAVFMAPFVEEFLFRGVLFGTLRRRSRRLAYVVSVLVFSLYHVWQYAVAAHDPALLLAALQYVPVSVALTYCYDRTQSLWPPIFFHMLVNTLSLSVLTH